VVILLAILAPSAKGQVVIGYEMARKSVVFLYGADASGQVDASVPLATGFLVNVLSKSKPSMGFGAAGTRSAYGLVPPI
jgi:hypothetical protein